MSADVCLVVEGTYPYVTGGVSGWLHNLIAHLPDFTFHILHLGSRPEAGRSPRYRFPPNVKGYQEVFLSDGSQLRRPSRFRHSAADWALLRSFHESLGRGHFEESLDSLRSVMARDRTGRTASDLVFAAEAWHLLVERYRQTEPSSSFLDYFWTFRSTHLPLFILHQTQLPPARLYHTVSTGYAGYAASLAKLRGGSPLIITEHGIYTREREMELALSGWSRPTTSEAGGQVADPRPEVFQGWWRNMFRYMSQLTYSMSDWIISITAGGQQYQIRDGADPSRLQVIPNGIAVDRFRSLRADPGSTPGSFTVGFVGRVVPIKDVKTFIQAVQIARETILGLRALIVGPIDEDPDYVSECRELVMMMDLAGTVRFTGRANVGDYYRQMDVLVLTSLSEAQPLVLLEANCAGIPVVATDVGACRELLEGATPEDRALGRSGLLTLPASPHETADALVRLWRDEALRRTLGRAGQERVQRFYREEAVYQAYRDLYRRHLDGAPALADKVSTWPG